MATRQIDKFDKLRGRDGKDRPVKYKKIIANTPKEAETALKIIGDLPDNCDGKDAGRDHGQAAGTEEPDQQKNRPGDSRTLGTTRTSGSTIAGSKT